MLAREISSAKSEVLVQSYGLTHPLILRALADDKALGVTVRIILDRINESHGYTGATYLVDHEIEALIDDQVALSHNKILIIDQQTVITGSMNFTVAAQKRNAEDVLIIGDDTLNSPKHTGIIGFAERQPLALCAICVTTERRRRTGGRS
jgi:phosphatidylserine/phosphatidylglycerophosphate/cardiolipin synthase-like enzyme